MSLSSKSSNSLMRQLDRPSKHWGHCSRTGSWISQYCTIRDRPWDFPPWSCSRSEETPPPPSSQSSLRPLWPGDLGCSLSLTISGSVDPQAVSGLEGWRTAEVSWSSGVVPVDYLVDIHQGVRKTRKVESNIWTRKCWFHSVQVLWLDLSPLNSRISASLLEFVSANHSPAPSDHLVLWSLRPTN